MSQKKDKQKVLGEVFSDERIKTFLDYDAYGDIDPDFHVLEKAYRGMKADNFATFLTFFNEAGKNINATNPQGDTFLATIADHQKADEYIHALKDAGAK